MPKKSQKEESAQQSSHEMHLKNAVLLQQKILENLIELQKVHTGLAEKFDKLANNIANLLNIFEMAARTFAQNPANQASEKDKEFLEKIDKLLEQNKTIAKGLMLMEERVRERAYGRAKPEEEYELSPASRPLPRF